MAGAAGAPACATAVVAYATVSVTSRIAFMVPVPFPARRLPRNSTVSGGRAALPLSQEGAGGIAGLRGSGRERRLGGHAGEQSFEQIGVIFNERELREIGRGFPPDGAVLLQGFEPTLVGGELEVVARDDREERDGEAILFAEGVDVASAAKTLLDSGEERLLIGRSEERIAGEGGEQIRGVGGGVDPAFGGIEAAGVALVAQVGEGAGEQGAVLGGREEWLLEVALGEGCECERGE